MAEIKDIFDNDNLVAPEILLLIQSLANRYREEEEKYSYQINLIDILGGANENAHSRILLHFLQQKTGAGKFEVLESLIRYIQEKYNSFWNILVETPDFEYQKKNIDLRVSEARKYSIILENKVHNAPEMDEQLGRYIENTLDDGFNEDQIYIIYLSPTFDMTPSNQTWGGYKESFKERFVNFSFRDDVLPWLNDWVLPNVNQKDTLLSSALVQYIDLLNGMFNLRNNKKYMELHEFLKNEWGLKDDDPQNNIAELLKKQTEINNLFETLKNSFEKELFQIWVTKIKEICPDCQQLEPTKMALELKIPVKDTTVRVSVDYNDQYCNVDRWHLEEGKQDLPHDIAEKLKRFSPSYGGQYFARPKTRGYDVMYDLLSETVQTLIEF
ncbi:MAG: PD-(D/E)XK nuclease family protein [Marinilabiliaceae bacterium]|nr:PD-(D/E)XK nuclease family protein [Marinilabiliaceae bacterium]